MTAISSFSDAISKATAGGKQTIWAYIDPRIGSSSPAGSAIGYLSSLWKYNKAPGAIGVTPTTAQVCDKSTLGALPFTNPASGKQMWLTGLEASVNNVAGVLMLYDRLVQQGGFNASLTTAQSMSAVSLTRNTGGEGNQIFAEINSTLGTTATTFTVSYTNSAGVSGRTTQVQTIGGTNYRETERLIPLALQAGDTGVRSIQSVTLAASTTTAGDFALIIAKPLGMVACESGGALGVRDYLTGVPSTPEVYTDACLALAFLNSGSGVPPRAIFAVHLLES